MDFNQWWNSFGQFLPPCDKLADYRVLEGMKRFAKRVWESRDREVESSYQEGYELGEENVREAMRMRMRIK